MEFKIYPNFSENEIVFLTKLIDKKCNINMDTILTKKIMKIWYDNNRKLYEYKLKNDNNLKKQKKNKKLYEGLEKMFNEKCVDEESYNRRYYHKQNIILNNETGENFKNKTEKKLLKYTNIKNKLENDRNYRLSIIKNN